MAAGPDLDPAAFTAFHAGTAGPLWGYLKRIGDDAALADDVLQESYLRFLSRPPAAASNERERRSYLFQIATNLMRDRWRRENTERTGLARFLPGESGWTRGRTTADQLDCAAALARLRPRDRALLWLAHVEGYEHREIAEILGLRTAGVRVLLFRARKKMMQNLETTR